MLDDNLFVTRFDAVWGSNERNEVDKILKVYSERRGASSIFLHLTKIKSQTEINEEALIILKRKSFQVKVHAQ